ncbi:EAL domain-containing protein [Deinococcus sp.]|uniref:EAL domain-containing protein n=1 Tax=Deinococcus sp. TaxID=47478 RepID=UPI003CC63928
MNHACACHRFRPDRATHLTALVIRASDPACQRRFAAALHAHGVPVRDQPAGVCVETGELSALGELFQTLSPADRASLHAVPVVPDGPEPWALKPLGSWLARLSSPWFSEAARQLAFHAQPIVCLNGGEVFGYEALVRARQGERLIGAGALLEAASAHEELRAFDAHCRTAAIEQLYPRLGAGEALFINFAPGVIYNPDVCLQTTFQACRAVDADFSRLVFEITEGEAYPDLRLLRSIIDRYRQEGARVALDDLGSGHTSLSYLAELRPDFVKIDQMLVRQMSESAAAVRLVRSLTEYAHELGSRVVAEGIETLDLLEAAGQTGVDFVQGYYLGRPSQELSGVLPGARSWWAASRP